MLNIASTTFLILAGVATIGVILLIILAVVYHGIAQSWAEALGMKRKK
jgi:hypothetical protein